jgi:hypothetical protein
MKGATMLLGSMNRQMNLPSLQRIAMEFERENDIMDQRQEMMDDAIDDVTGLEDEEEGEEVVNQVLDEIGVDLNNAVCQPFPGLMEAPVLTLSSSERPLQEYRVLRCQKVKWHKPLGEGMRTMIYRLDLIACAGKQCLASLFITAYIKHGVMEYSIDDGLTHGI